MDVDMLERIMGLYEIPFKQDGYESYIWDACNQMVADFFTGLSEGTLSPRGWGRMQYLEEGTALHEACKAFLLSLVDEKQRTDPDACVEAFNNAWIKYRLRDTPRPYTYTVGLVGEDNVCNVKEWPSLATHGATEPTTYFELRNLVFDFMRSMRTEQPEPTGNRWVVVFNDKEHKDSYGELAFPVAFCSEEILYWEINARVGACQDNLEDFCYKVLCLD